VESGLQWDAPNAWPPHIYIVMQALLAMPSNITKTPLPSGGNGSFAALPSGQLGMDESGLPPQPMNVGGSINATGKDADVNFANGTWHNGGNATDGEGWRDALARGIANRYVGSAICSYQATGGSVPGVLPQLPPDQRITGAENLTGVLFEKFSVFDIDSGGRGGEYTVQAGFGWTNGVALWASSRFGKVLVAPVCPQIVNGTDISPSGGSSGNSPGGGSGGSVRNALPSALLAIAAMLVPLLAL